MGEVAILPDNPSHLPTTKTIRACVDIFKNRDVIVGALTFDQATEALRRAGAIEKYVSSKEHKDEARRAARILETAVGEALGPADDIGGRGKKASLASEGIHYQDRHRFRLMAEYRHQRACLPLLEPLPFMGGGPVTRKTRCLNP